MHACRFNRHSVDLDKQTCLIENLHDSRSFTVFSGSLERGTVEWNSGTMEWNSGMVERWNTGMVERAINDPVPFLLVIISGPIGHAH